MNRKKKRISILLLLIMICMCVSAEVEASECNHSSGTARVQYKAPTCTEAGNYAYRVCKLNDCIINSAGKTVDISEVIIPPLGHTEETVPGYEPTCIVNGLTDGKKCAVCGEVTVAQEVIPSSGHNEITETNTVENPTCATDGKKVVITYCDVCNETLKEETVMIPATGEHKHTEEVAETKVPSTCTTQGSVNMRCACGDTITAVIDIDENAHSWDEWVLTKNSTCVSVGEETRVCTYDSTHIECREISVKTDAHEWGEWTVTKNPTCTLEGKEYRICVNDTTHTEKRAIPAKSDAHTLTSRIENEVSASCGADGYYTVVVYCSVCGETTDRQTVTVPATGNHNYVTENPDTKEPSTCVKEGSVQMQCDCGAVKTISLPIDKSNHNWSENGRITVNATCVYEGEITYSCLNIGCNAENKEQLSIDADAHTWDNGNIIKTPTCISEGVIEYSCVHSSLHKRTEKISIDKNAHNPLTETRNYIDATCGKNGSYDTVTFCADCKVVLKTILNTIPATGEHNYTEEVSGTKVPPTCISDGSVTLKCQCGAEKISKLPMDANAHIPDSEGYDCILCGKELRCRHNWTSEKVIIKESSCIENGSKAVICTKCNEPKSGTVEMIPASGHSFVNEWKTVTNPSCSNAGVKIRICRNCFDFITESIPKLNHTDNNKDYICDNCNTVTDMSAFVGTDDKTDDSDDNKTDNKNENNSVNNCSCDCHKTGFTKVLFSIINFFEKLFGSNKTCKCGVRH